jgi:formaldehyde-activating enzyme involved in methanogenesis
MFESMKRAIKGAVKANPLRKKIEEEKEKKPEEKEKLELDQEKVKKFKFGRK